jgi:NodT family efflux transporter outer membrane factor (OMF) lipoprotein
MVGPTYRRPAAPVADAWTSGCRATAVGGCSATALGGSRAAWWRVFDDPILDALVALAYRQNPSLEAAGSRVLQAQALRGIAIGQLFPQSQAASASFVRQRASLNTGVPVTRRSFSSWQAGFDAAWELDLWGRFRRGIEAADAELVASVADYDDVLVSLVAEVAADYVQLRVLDARLALATDNVRVQRESLRIATVRYEAGGTSNLDVQQALTQLRGTESTLPVLATERRRVHNALLVLLGIPPPALDDLVGSCAEIPAAPPSVAVGIPAELLGRRPDVRRAERRLAAQSARIGVATADLLPRISLTGSVGLSADQASQLFAGNALAAIGGPRFDWPILNYGRLINAVRVEDAAFQELVEAYVDTVLRAQQDVEDALVGYVRGGEQVVRLAEASAAADRALDLSVVQYREGAADYTRVLTAQQAKLQADDTLASARGNVTLSVIALNKALGGGWELRADDDFVREDTKDAMRARTWWGGMLRPTRRARAIDGARERMPTTGRPDDRR